MKLSHKKKGLLLSLIVVGLIFYFAFPKQLFSDPYATTLWSKNGTLLSVKIAKDEQWRFPEVDSIPEALKQSVLLFEDEYFYWHPGFNPVSTLRALWQNLKSDKIISGGSTISMQVIRLSRKQKKRTYREKLIEMYLAFRMECSFSKDEILKMYVSHAPYGGNIVGVEAAAWRYFQRPLHQLSQAEYATLAVLPNAPSLIHLGKNRTALLKKRNRLLLKLYNHKLIDPLEYSLSIMEPIPDKPSDLPQLANHLIDFSIINGMEEQHIKSTIDARLQQQISQQIDKYINKTSENEIRNACALVVSLDKGEVISYVGNTQNPSSGAKYVDLIQAPRSSGSILKPFLYALATDEGIIQNSSLLKDIPISIDQFSPKNFDKTYEGVVPADKALAKSLNIPAALLLKDYGVGLFYDKLKALGFSTLNRPADDYGLSLILGGAEVSLWDLSKIYTQQALLLNSFNKNTSTAPELKLWTERKGFSLKQEPISVGAWWLISQALTEPERPYMEQNWRLFSSSKTIAWKTGTSHGFRDAWAIGYDADHLVAVWVGNAEGDGRPGLTGISVAAPLMFQIFRNFSSHHWFEKPEMALKNIQVCQHSGYLPTLNCPKVSCEIPIHAQLSQSCNYHKKILLNNKGQRVYKSCATSAYTDTVWFSLSPLLGHYYKKTHYNYQALPPFSEACSATNQKVLAFIYPLNHAKIIIPKDFDGQKERIVLEATHTNSTETLYWHLDKAFIGQTTYPHKLTIKPINKGKHQLMIMDTEGRSAVCSFRIY